MLDITGASKYSNESPKEISDHIVQSIESIAKLHARVEHISSPHERLVERVTIWLGRPSILYALIIFALSWIGANVVFVLAGNESFDPAPYFWLQGLHGFLALAVTIIVLITQARQMRLSESRAHLDLEMSLLAEQKITKLIALIEELRRDIPQVSNREDAEAQAMSQPSDPEVVLNEIEQSISRVVSKLHDTRADSAHIAKL